MTEPLCEASITKPDGEVMEIFLYHSLSRRWVWCHKATGVPTLPSGKTRAEAIKNAAHFWHGDGYTIRFGDASL